MDVCVPASAQHSPKKNKGGGRGMIPIELYNIVMINMKVDVIPLGETWPMNMQCQVKPLIYDEWT